MFSAKRQLLTAVAACALGLCAAAVRADDSSPTTMPSTNDNDQLQQKVEQLEAKVATLETQQTQTQAQVNDSIQKVMADADSRSKLLDSSSVTTGYDSASGFHIASDDGNFFMHPWALFQFDGVINYRTSVTPTDEGEVGQKGTMVQDGFDIRRAELGVDGHLWTPNFKYYVMLITGNGTGVPVLDDAYMTYQIGDGPFIVKAGQFVDPVWHEDNVGDEYQLVADRSLVNAIIGGSELGLTRLGFDAERVEGVGVRFEQGNIHAEADLHNGYNSANTKFIDTANMPFAPKPENFGMSGRFEYKVFGDDAGWDEYKQFSALNDKEDILILGTGCEWTENGDENNFFYTFDGQYDTTWGLGAYAAVYGYNDNIPKAVVITPGTAAIAGHFLNSGFLAQGGYLIPNTQWEPYIRWDLTHLDGKLSQQQHTTNEFTLGANYYLFGQHAKVSGDVTFMPSGPPVDADSLGILADERRKEFVGRIQFQLAI